MASMAALELNSVIGDVETAFLVARRSRLPIPNGWAEVLYELVDQEVRSWDTLAQEWRRASILHWRRVYAEAADEQTREYSECMLKRQLLDPVFIMSEPEGIALHTWARNASTVR